MLEKLRAEGPLFVVDAGDLFWKNARSAPSADLPQIQEKARLIAEAYQMGGIDAISPSAADLTLGLPFLQELRQTWKLPFVSTNLSCDGAAPWDTVRTVDVAGIHVGIYGIVGDEADREGCVHTDPAQSLVAAIGKDRPDLVVVLSDLPEVDNQRLAEATRIDFLIDSNRQQRTNPPNVAGGGLLLGAGSRGRSVGALSFTLTPGATRWEDEGSRSRIASQKDRYAERLAQEKTKLATATEADRPRIERQISFLEGQLKKVEAELADATTTSPGPANHTRNQFTDLGTDVADHAPTLALVDKAKARIAAATPVTTDTHVRMGPFAGSQTCQGCHTAEYAQWLTTPHATANESLRAQKSDQDPACFACHVTGAHHPDGPRVAAEVAPILLNVGCESCHGAGKEHGQNPSTVPMERNPGPGVCMSCHDGERDEGRFDFATYRPKIVHTAPKKPSP